MCARAKQSLAIRAQGLSKGRLGPRAAAAEVMGSKEKMCIKLLRTRRMGEMEPERDYW